MTAGTAAALPLHDGVVVDVERGVAYLAGTGGLAAVDLSTGAERWSSDAAIRPLTLAGDRLIAQGTGDRGALTLVALDAAAGKVAQRAEVPLPNDVRAAAVRGGTVFHLVATPMADGGGAVLVAWKAVRGSAGGWLPSAHEGAVPAIDDKAGRAETFASEPSLIEITGAAIFDPRSGAVREPPRAGKSSPAAPARLVELESAPAKARAGGERRFLSLDGRHVLISARRDAEGDRGETAWQRYRWTVVERDSGARLGTLDHHIAALPFLVADGRLIFVEPRHARRSGDGWQELPQALRAIDLSAGKGGAEAWAKTVDDVNQTGPFAP